MLKLAYSLLLVFAAVLGPSPSLGAGDATVGEERAGVENRGFPYLIRAR